MVSKPTIVNEVHLKFNIIKQTAFLAQVQRKLNLLLYASICDTRVKMISSIKTQQGLKFKVFKLDFNDIN